MTTTEHPNFQAGTKVRARGYNLRGEVIFSANDKVVVNWGNNVQSYDGWSVSNNMVRLATS